MNKVATILFLPWPLLVKLRDPTVCLVGIKLSYNCLNELRTKEEKKMAVLTVFTVLTFLYQGKVRYLKRLTDLILTSKGNLT